MAPDASASPPSGEALAKLKSIVGAKGWIDAPDDLAPWLTDRRGHYTGRCALMVRPASTRERSSSSGRPPSGNPSEPASNRG